MEHPILFSTEMVQAILEGRKTQTRRVCKASIPEWIEKEDGACKVLHTGTWKEKPCWWIGADWGAQPYFDLEIPRCPYGKPGDTLWIRETWCEVTRLNDCEGKHSNLCGGIDSWHYYKADGKKLPEGYQWRPSIHMPREAARLFLLVKDIRVERLQDISEKDAKAEGFSADDIVTFGCNFGTNLLNVEYTGPARTAINSFKVTWHHLNDKRGYGWDINSWVWVVEFEVIKNAKRD